MSYKIKVKPEDFFVREMASVELKQKGPYGIFILKKRGWNTLDAIKKISQKFRIPLENISYGGKKDRHATTEQFISIKDLKKDISFADENYSLKLIGFSSTPMEPRLIMGNVFKIAVRDLSESKADAIVFHLEKIKEQGFINYFDDQRFGSYDPKQGFIGEKILKGHLNGALKIYLTHVYPEDKKEEKERKRFFFENWSNWELCLSRAKTNFEKMAFTHLISKGKEFLTLLRKIPKEEMSLFFSAYQSYIWNELVRRLIEKQVDRDNLLVHRGIAGEYIFVMDADRKLIEYLKNTKVPTPSSKAKMPDDTTDRIYREILNEREITPSKFNLREIRHAFFKSVERAVLVIPESFMYRFENDEIYEGKKKLILAFILPRGSYATMLIKRIFAKKIKKE